MRKLALKLCIGGVALGITSIGALAAYCVHLERTAANITNDVSALLLNQSTFVDAKLIAERYSGRISTEWLEPIAPPDRREHSTECTPARCSFNFRVKNDKLALLKVFPRAEFMANVVVLNDRVKIVHVYLFGGQPNAGAGTTYSDNVYKLRFVTSGYALWVPQPGDLDVSISDDASAKQKQRAFSLETKCLVHLGHGCDSPGDYLPLAWSDWQKADKKQGHWLGWAASL